MFVQRIRVRFQKVGELIAISHLDLMRAFERALRRANLPLRMSEGFNPHPRISFPAALGLGIEALDEVMEFDLSDWVTPREIEDRLRAQLPQGINIFSLVLADPHQAAHVQSVIYRAQPHEKIVNDPRLQAEKLAEILARDTIEVQRMRKGREKTVNIRPFILSLEREGEGVSMKLSAGPEGSAHPEEILGLLGFDAQERRGGFKLIRTRVLLDN